MADKDLGEQQYGQSAAIYTLRLYRWSTVYVSRI